MKTKRTHRVPGPEEGSTSASGATVTAKLLTARMQCPTYSVLVSVLEGGFSPVPQDVFWGWLRYRLEQFGDKLGIVKVGFGVVRGRLG